MLAREENPRQMLRRLGNRRQLIDPADDFIAERQGLRPGAFRVHLVHDFPMPKALRRSATPLGWSIQVQCQRKTRFVRSRRSTGSSPNRLGQPVNDENHQPLAVRGATTRLRLLNYLAYNAEMMPMF